MVARALKMSLTLGSYVHPKALNLTTVQYTATQSSVVEVWSGQRPVADGRSLRRRAVSAVAPGMVGPVPLPVPLDC